MPLAAARSASSLPTSLAAAMLAPVLLFSRIVFSSDDAAASVSPLMSSMTCAWMCFDERNTDRRARPLLMPASLTLRLTDAVRRAVRSFKFVMAQALLLLLAFLAEDVLAGVLHALTLVRLGRTEAAQLRRHLADLLLVDAGDDDLGRLRRRDRDALRDRIVDVVREAELQVELLALDRSAIADAGVLELLLEALGDAGDQVVHQRARGAPLREGPLALGTRLDLDRALVEADRHVVVQHDLKRALGALHLDRLPFHVGGDAGRDGYGTFSDTRHQNTVQMISPPTLASRASWSAITPFGVDRMAMPSPLLMRGSAFTEA